MRTINIWTDVRWVPLKQKCPIEIEGIINRAEECYNDLRVYEGEDNETIRLRLILLKSKLYSIVSTMLGIVHRKEVLKKEQDEIVFYRLQENYGRLLGNLDEIYKEKLLSTNEETQLIEMMMFVNEATSFLISTIYQPLKNAIEISENNKERFVYAFYHSLALNLGVFGSIARGKVDFTGKPNLKEIQNYIPMYEDMISKKGQDDLKKEYDDQIKILFTHKEEEEPDFMEDDSSTFIEENEKDV